MALHQIVQRVLLIGAHLESLPPLPAPRPPAALAPLIEAIAGERRRFDERAIHFGHRYRSGFWAIYLLSAVAVLFAVMPLALGWDTRTHFLHPYAGVWALGEVCVIGTVSAIYWLGHRRDWQTQWLRARTTAELSGYLPMLAPLLDFTTPAADADWYLRIFDPGQHLRGADDVARLCAANEPLARRLLANAWSDPAFIESYARWTIDVLEGQRHYHYRTASRQHALRHRVHSVNSALFGLTAVGALLHLAVHTLWLSLVTDVLPGARLLSARRARAVRGLSSRHHLRTPGDRIAGCDRTHSRDAGRAWLGDGREFAQGGHRGGDRVDTGGAPRLAPAGPAAQPAAGLRAPRVAGRRGGKRTFCLPLAALPHFAPKPAQ